MLEVVAVTATTPPELIVIASVSLTEPILPSSGITILPPVVIKPPPVYVPLTSKLAFISHKVAFNSISSVALISNVVALGAFIFCEASLNCSCIVLFNNKPVSATCVNVTSLSAPNERIAASDINRKSSPTDKSAAIPAPPATVRAPSEAFVLEVVAVTATTPPELIVIAFVSLAEPIEPASGITIDPLPPFNVNTPVELKFIFSDAVSLAAVLNDNLVALLEEEKSPSETASIPAATRIASVPVPSSGAWKLMVPIISSAAISVSPVANVNITGLSSPVAVCFNVKPLS